MRSRVLLVAVGFAVLLGLGVSASPALANNADFFCNLAPGTLCTGSVFGSGSSWNTGLSGLGFYQDAGPQPLNTLFTLTFNTASSNTLTLTSKLNGEMLVGTYDPKNFSVATGNTTTTLSWSGVQWTLPPDFQTFMGGPFGIDNSFTTVIGIDCGIGGAGCPNQSGDIVITPIPEPSSLSMLAFGLLLPGGGLAIIRRRFRLA